MLTVGFSDGSGPGHGHVVRVELLKMSKNGQFPDEPVRIRIKDTQIHYVTYQTYEKQKV